MELEKKVLNQYKMEQKILDWIQSKQNVLDKIIGIAAEDFRFNNQNKNFIYDCSETSKELWNLGQGKDLCYDRPTIGFIYSLWYHGKRVNTFLRYFFNLITQSLDEKYIEILDLGAGTGAVQWAVGITYAALKDLNIRTPEIHIINVDSSPFMLQYNEKYLWEYFVNEFPVCREIKIDYTVNSWTNTEANKATNIWLSASYLFDHSENSSEIAIEFEKLIEEHKPNKLLLLSAKPKKYHVDVVANSILQLGYSNHNQSTSSLLQIYSGNLTYISSKIRKLKKAISLKPLSQ